MIEYNILIRVRLKPGRPRPSDIEPGWEPQDTLFTGTLTETSYKLRWTPALDHPDLERVIVHSAEYPVAEEIRAAAKEHGVEVVEEAK